ncbi:nitrophenyl compound nitroreductase subunit ArsF family protein [Geobacter sp. OR-1]|uniref:nitrophenyl compound nitroreductase subunit ArsF family protein n=1 Tax=Geobacter sp. OR-1 TaxID=1266765 RepID=UPI00351C3AD0
MVYYFHGTVRCETCLFIETVAEGTLKSEFSDDLATGRLTWRSINIDHQENVHFASDYNIGPNELVVIRTNQSGNITWEKITGTWDLAADPGRLSVTVRDVVLKFLGKR